MRGRETKETEKKTEKGKNTEKGKKTERSQGRLWRVHVRTCPPRPQGKL